jgi:hypothetical protein
LQADDQGDPRKDGDNRKGEEDFLGLGHSRRFFQIRDTAQQGGSPYAGAPSQISVLGTSAGSRELARHR